MANTKLKTRAPFISVESLSIGAFSETLANAGATIPQNTGEIWVYVSSGNLFWTPNGFATTTFAHSVPANQWFLLSPSQHLSSIKSTSGSDATVFAIYMRGSSRADAFSLSAPY